MMKTTLFTAHLLASALPLLAQTSADQQPSLRDSLTFYCSFEGTAKAEIAGGESEIFTAPARRRFDDAKQGLHNPDVSIVAGKGLVGDALEFRKKTPIYTFYNAEGNVAYDPKSFSGAVSFWLQLDPAVDLEPGFCDPIQITDRNYNDAALWIDFSDVNPRDLRLGVFGDLTAWNPQDLPPNKNPDFERRLVPVKKPPFQRGKWTHILFNYDQLSSEQGSVELFIDGQSKGTREGVSEPFTWELSKSKIMIGINYIGLMDELAIFARPLSEKEVEKIYRAKGGLKSLLP